MLKVLINCYACCPGMGSEPGMGWNWVTGIARHCEVHVISEGEFCTQAEAASRELPIHWHWNPVPERVRKICWNQGDWRFYFHYEKWQRRTAEIAEEICRNERIDILHQLNMIGFREPGYLWKISQRKGIPFVWGPIGGLKQYPIAYADGGGIRMQMFQRLKNLLNHCQLLFAPRVSAALRQASVLISSIPDSEKAIKRIKGLDSIVIPETGCMTTVDPIEKDFHTPKLRVMWVGKFDFRKRLDIALRAFAEADNPNIELEVWGSGSEAQNKQTKALWNSLGKDHLKLRWMGNRTHDEVLKAMKEAHLFLFTSVSEDTSTVVMEAISSLLPVVCFDCCGMGHVVNEKVGRKVTLTNPRESVHEIAAILNNFQVHRNQLQQMSLNCADRAEELSWKRKMQELLAIYRSVV